MKKILLLTTGGTIACRAGTHGLAPALNAVYISAYIQGYGGQCCFDHESLMELDSSNIQPEQWKIIARRIFSALGEYDGIIVTHGTDTMAYTAAALSFMLADLNKSVVLTGSQLPIENPFTDARVNLATAVEAILGGITGVSVAFNRRIINGTRAVKINTMDLDAFQSINAEPLGQIYADGTRIFQRRDRAKSACALLDSICTDVILLKLIPGTKPEIFDKIIEMGYRGIVLETFGAGGMHDIDRDLLAGLSKLRFEKIPVVACSQCLYERCDLSLYEVGQKLLAAGVIPARDMTSEAAVTKLMWALGQADDLGMIKKMFATNYAGEISL